MPRSGSIRRVCLVFQAVSGNGTCTRLSQTKQSPLLYVGIAPSRPQSSNTLRKRIKYHLRGNADGSTLRLSLGCLLADELGIELCRLGSSGRKTFGPDEAVLSAWMAENAFVTWTEHPEPWHLEDELIRGLSLPLNLRGNERHPFYPQLAAIRKGMKQQAR